MIDFDETVCANCGHCIGAMNEQGFYDVSCAKGKWNGISENKLEKDEFKDCSDFFPNKLQD